MLPHSPSAVSVIGLGAMGQALAGAFLAGGHHTTVWNRSAGKADALVAKGAVLAETVADAVSASRLVVVCVVDYDASQQILEPVGELLSGRVLVNLTSDTPERSRAAAEWAAGLGIDYLDGAVMVPTVVIGQPEALVLYSGSEVGFEASRSTLSALGGRATFLGTDPGTAALYDLGMLDIFYSTMASLVHAFAFVGADKVNAKEFAPFAQSLIAILPDIIAGMADDLDKGQYPGADGNLRMEAAGIEHIIRASRARGLDVGALESVHGLAERAIAKGHGADGFSSLIEVLTPGG